MTSSNKITLRITGPDGSIRESTVEQESLILGSGPGAAIQIADPQISTVHLLLKLDRSGAVRAIDLGSEHGTRLGNQLLQGPVSLSPGDVLAIGKYLVQVIFVPAQHARPQEGAHLPSGASAQSAAPHRTDASTAPALVFEVPVREEPTAPAARAREAISTFPIRPTEAVAGKGRRVLEVALAWGDRLLGVQHYGDGFPVTIGEGQKNEFHVFSASVGQSFTLASSRRGKATVRVPPGAALSATGPTAKLTTSPAGARTVELSIGDAARVDVENVSFLVREVLAPKGVSGRTADGRDWSFFALTACLLLASAAAMYSLIVRFYNPDIVDSIADDEKRELVKLLIRPHPTPPQEVKVVPKREEEKTGAEEGAKAKDEEGKFGIKEATKEDADPSRAGSPIVDPNKKEKDRKKVQRTGLFAAFGPGSSEGSSNTFGPGGFGTGINSALGGIKGGAGFGDAHGMGGLGTRGTGHGGGGTGLGLGGLGTKGDGRGGGGGCPGCLDLGGKGTHQTVKVIPGTTRVIGGLSREVIDKVIRSHYSEIKYCYEAELPKSPDLAGKVAALFTIGPDGSVTEASVNESTIGSGAVEQCMMGRIRRWKFPEVPGGGVVVVTYPWVFKPSGAGGEG